MTVADNMSFSMRLRGAPKPEIDARVKRASEILGLGELLGRFPRQMTIVESSSTTAPLTEPGALTAFCEKRVIPRLLGLTRYGITVGELPESKLIP